jgi:DNA-binding NarL/FixJ family response regulator
MAQPIRVVIADDSARARDGLRALLMTWPEIAIAGEAVDGQDAVRLVEECRPDAVLLDLNMPELDGVQVTRIVKQRWPDTTVIVLTVHAGDQVAAREAGADAFVIKGSASERLRSALGVGVAGQKP